MGYSLKLGENPPLRITNIDPCYDFFECRAFLAQKPPNIFIIIIFTDCKKMHKTTVFLNGQEKFQKSYPSLYEYFDLIVKDKQNGMDSSDLLNLFLKYFFAFSINIIFLFKRQWDSLTSFFIDGKVRQPCLVLIFLFSFLLEHSVSV